MKTLLILFIVFLLSCAQGDFSRSDIDRADGPDGLIYGLEMTQITGTHLDWVMHSEFVERFSHQQRWVAYNVLLETVGDEQNTFFQSDSAFISDFDDVMIGMGNVVITSPSGILRTEKIIWNRMSDEVEAPDRFVLLRGIHEFRGYELFTNSHLTFIDMRRVSAEGYICPDELGF
jgi:hypothetical protein